MSRNVVDKILVICFPFAGGTSRFFDILEEDLPNHIELVKLEYSGHGDRIRAPLYKSFDELAADLYPQICDLLSRRVWCKFALLGYSMGCISAFAVLQKMIKEESPHLPVHVFFAAHPPKQLLEIQSMQGDILIDWVKKRTISYGAVPNELIHNRAFWSLYLPIYIADYKMISVYDLEHIRFTCDIPMTVFYVEEDTPLEDMKQWMKYFTGAVRFVKYEGTHFFIQQHHRDMMRIICSHLNNERTSKI